MTQLEHRTHTALEPDGEAAVGRVAIWAAWLEYALAELVSSLLNSVNGAGGILTNDMMASKLIDLSRKLLKNEFAKLPLDLQDRTTKALTTASAALQQRNQILHGMVGGSLEPGATAFHNRKRPGAAHHYNAVELDLMGERLYASMLEIQDCAWTIEGHIRNS